MEERVGAQKKRPYQNRIMTLDYEGEAYHIWFRREIYDLNGIKRRDIKPEPPNTPCLLYTSPSPRDS